MKNQPKGSESKSETMTREETLTRLSAAASHHSNGQQEIKERASLSVRQQSSRKCFERETSTKIGNAAVLTGLARRPDCRLGF